MTEPQMTEQSIFDDYGDGLLERVPGVFVYSGTCTNKSVISEGSLSRLLALSEKADYTIVTAYRSEYTKAENIQRNRQLRGIINVARMGAQQLVGHWRECTILQDNGNPIPYEQCPKNAFKDVIERSYFFTRRSDLQQSEFEAFVLNLVRQFDQDAAVIKLDDVVYLLTNAGTKFIIGTKPEIGKIAQAWSQHVKKTNVPFVFEGVECPTTIQGRFLMQHAGILPGPGWMDVALKRNLSEATSYARRLTPPESLDTLNSRYDLSRGYMLYDAGKIKYAALNAEEIGNWLNDASAEYPYNASLSRNDRAVWELYKRETGWQAKSAPIK